MKLDAYFMGDPDAHIGGVDFDIEYMYSAIVTIWGRIMHAMKGSELKSIRIKLDDKESLLHWYGPLNKDSLGDLHRAVRDLA